MMDGEPSLMKPVKEPTSNLPLPNDVVLSCLARVSRSYYPTLSLVSKSFRSLLASPELYKTRSLLNRTERCLYVCLQFPPDPKPRWFTLCLKPNKTLTSNESSCHVLVPISNINSPQVDQFSLVGSGHDLYAICEAAPCSIVSCLDYRTNTWFKAPTMRLAHTGTHFDGSMYLARSCENPESLNCVEVFDTKIQSWKPVQPEKRKFNLRNMEGISTNGLALNAKESKWEVLGLCRDLDLLSVCQIDNIIYLYKFNGEFIWTDRKVGGRVQRKLEGLEGLPKLGDNDTVKLFDYGGKIGVSWDEYVPKSVYKEKMIWCAVISLEKRSSKEIWGKVEWFDVVLTVPNSYKFVCAVAATV